MSNHKEQQKLGIKQASLISTTGWTFQDFFLKELFQGPKVLEAFGNDTSWKSLAISPGVGDEALDRRVEESPCLGQEEELQLKSLGYTKLDQHNFIYNLYKWV